MDTRGKYISILLVDDDDLCLKSYWIALKPGKYQSIAIKRQINKGVRMIILIEYRDLLTRRGSFFGKTFDWLKKPLKLMDRISKLKNIDEM